MMKVLVTPPYFRPVPDKYLEVFRRFEIAIDTANVTQFMTEPELLPIIARYDGVIAGDDQFTARVIEEGARHSLRVISKWGVGIDSIDVEAATRCSVTVCRSAGALSDAVATVTWGYIVMLARQLHVADRLVRNGEWRKIGGVDLRGRALGIIGVGSIGKEVARRAAPFGMRLLGNDIRAIEADFLAGSGMEMLSKADLLRQSDFIVLACDLNPSSLHILSGPDFELMKPSAYVINVARGPLIETNALAAALRTEGIAGAALDVHEIEPLPPGSAILDCPNTILNAHNAFNTDLSVQFVNDNTVRQLLAVLRPGEAVDF